jgi:hypothetical protein
MSIPTMYSGVQMRSLLEAKWAAFFDLLGWRWEYEPFELDGWIPDFLIHCETGKRILVDVKPFFDRADFEPIKCKVERAVGPEKYIPWITTAAPMPESDWHTVGEVGGCCENGDWFWSAAVIKESSKRASVYGFGEAPCGAWGDMITGSHGKNYPPPLTFFEVKWFWRAACNRVQWMPRREAS